MYSLAASHRFAYSFGRVPMTPLQAKPLVIIVDDDVSVRESLGSLLALEDREVRSFESAGAFLDWSPPHGPKCLLLDVSLPDLSGLDVQDSIADRYPDMPIIFMTGYGDVPTSVRAMKAGAAEFLIKPLDSDVLLAAIDRALERSEAGLRTRAEQDALEARYASLSARERQVLRLIVAGLLNKQVGGELGISEITVKAHRGRLMTKMKAKTFADLVKMSARLNLDADPIPG